MRRNYRRRLDFPGRLFHTICVGGLLDRVFQLLDSEQEGVFQVVPQGHPEAGCKNLTKIRQSRMIDLFYYCLIQVFDIFHLFYKF